jgi:hypothetical protein
MMKYIITESQYKLITELERTWRDSDYKEQYDKLKHRLIPYFESIIHGYSENDFDIYLYDSDNHIIVSYIKISGELFYDRSLDDTYGRILPHPIWSVHGKYILSDVFERLYPNLEVKSVRSANIS